MVLTLGPAQAEIRQNQNGLGRFPAILAVAVPALRAPPQSRKRSKSARF